VSSEPAVSVIVPLYNLREFVGEAIESVLRQTLPPEQVEIVVVDDGSTDGGDEVVRGFEPRVRLLRQENRGLSAARNAGIRAAQARLLAFLDADDRIMPGKLAAHVALHDARPDVTISYSGVRYIDERGASLPRLGWWRLEGDVLPHLVLGNLIHPLAAVVRHEPVERAGGFDERLTSLEDWDLWLRLSRHGARWAYIDEALGEYRIRLSAMHQNAPRMAENAVAVLNRFFADPGLPPAIARLAPLAYQYAYLSAASDHFRVGRDADGKRWFRAAVTVRPSVLSLAPAARMADRRGPDRRPASDHDDAPQRAGRRVLRAAARSRGRPPALARPRRVLAHDGSPPAQSPAPACRRSAGASAAARGHALMAPRPLFLLACARTGSTLLQRLLNSYDDVLLWGEHAGFLEPVAEGFFHIWENPGIFQKTRVLADVLADSDPARSWQGMMGWYTRDDWLGLFRGFVEQLFVPHGLPGKQWWGFKEIRYAAHPGDRTLDFLHALYPDATWVFLVRNVFNAMASRRRMPGMSKTLRELRHVSQEWDHRYQTYREWHGSGRIKSFFIRYEDMIEGRGEVLELLQHLGKSFGERQQAVMESGEGRWSLFRDTAVNERWQKLPPAWVGLINAAAGRGNRAQGYPPLPRDALYGALGRVLLGALRVQDLWVHAAPVPGAGAPEMTEAHA
jgi:glycosyltransferase involved in cell wall biosynthesis